eukprot:TRINITY_DN34320_c0_g1_i1.p1 TRINITY_DN34320_c0_g1~~TRINITY_DN34320_c0_g1_i1.p1  ORF type:complete len:637 (+),score=79.24 TRINITY_DN34320_c0_g1_i1:112-2022(+)
MMDCWSFLCRVAAAASPAENHASLVQRVKNQQRASGAAREAWRNFCDSEGGGIRDPSKHEAAFLARFLSGLEQESGSLPEPAKMHESPEAQLVRSCSPQLEANQLELEMPSSEEGIMREVVDLNSYYFLPGRSSLLRPGDVVLDVGAHVGVLAALVLRTEGTRVVCVEPHPLALKFLRRNLSAFPERATIVGKAVSDTGCPRPLYPHSGTNNPSRLFFSSLFDTRSHDDNPITVECVSFHDLFAEHRPSVVKIDAEGAERFLRGVVDFLTIRLLVVEWDWTHNRHRSKWDSLHSHLEAHGFKVKVKGYMPAFDDAGHALLTDGKGKKRGKTGMIFVATRKTAIRGGGAELSAVSTKPSGQDGDSQQQRDQVMLPCGQPPLLKDHGMLPGEQPPLRQQLEPLTLEQMTERLKELGEEVRPATQEEFVIGFKARRRGELLEALLRAYQACSHERMRVVVRGQGVELDLSMCRTLLEAVRMIDWKENVRPQVNAGGYIVLKRPYELSAPPRWHERDQRAVRRRVWALAEALLRTVSSKAASFEFTAIAVSKNFQGSPHVDKNDMSVQYALSLGSFEDGGELCVEETPFLVRAFDTHNRFVCVDGRFPHWVSGYVGEGYSVIFYRSSGREDPRLQAVHEV